MKHEGGVSLGDALCLNTSKKGALFKIYSFKSDLAVWIPQSCIHDDSEVWKKGQRGDLVIMEWFAEKKGWI